MRAAQAAWPAAYTSTQEPPLVPEKDYPAPYGSATNTSARIQDNTITFSPPNVRTVGTITATAAGSGYTTPPAVSLTRGGAAGTATLGMTLDLQPKAIQELFELEYGRMNATPGFELPRTSINIQTTIPLGFVDPVTETLTDLATPGPVIAGDGTQIWKITHNGVDTHAIHFHLFNVQVINRVGWDGAIRPPDATELGWKETVIMNPLEDCIVALRPTAPVLPFKIGESIHPYMPEGAVRNVHSRQRPPTSAHCVCTLSLRKMPSS